MSSIATGSAAMHQPRARTSSLGSDKELLGGIDWWRRDGHPVTVSHEPGNLLAAE